VATWPVLEAVQKVLWGKRGLAVAVLTIALLGLVFVPFLAAVGTIVGHADEVVAKAKGLATLEVPATPPAWIGKLPLVGSKASAAWERHAGLGIKEAAAAAAPFAAKGTKWFVAQAGSVGGLLAEFLLTVVLAAVMYSTGESAAAGVVAFARRLAGGQGEGAVRLAAGAVRGVALGVIVTAVGQAVCISRQTEPTDFGKDLSAPFFGRLPCFHKKRNCSLTLYKP